MTKVLLDAVMESIYNNRIRQAEIWLHALNDREAHDYDPPHYERQWWYTFTAPKYFRSIDAAISIARVIIAESGRDMEVSRVVQEALTYVAKQENVFHSNSVDARICRYIIVSVIRECSGNETIQLAA